MNYKAEGERANSLRKKEYNNTITGVDVDKDMTNFDRLNDET